MYKTFKTSLVASQITNLIGTTGSATRESGYEAWVGQELGTSGFADIKFDLWGFTSECVVQGLELEYWHYEADGAENPAKVIEFVHFNNSGSDSGDFNAIQSASSLLEYEVHGNDKRKSLIVLGNSESDPGCALLTNVLRSENVLHIGVRRKTDTVDGGFLLGTEQLQDGEAESWNSGTPTAKTILTVIWNTPSTPTINWDMQYTTEDPTISQSTPVNSIGAWAAPNQVYSKTQTYKFFGKNDTTLYLDPSGTMPSSDNGLVQVGAEILRYGSKNDTAFTLTNLTRGVSPGVAYPARTTDNNEIVRFLSVDDLFNSRPYYDTQYRCIACKLTSPTPVKDISVMVRQNPSADVQIDIGIEVPRFDYRSGTTSAYPSGHYFLSSSPSVLGYDKDFFVGGHVIINPGNPSQHQGLITSYESDGVVATFFIDFFSAHGVGTTFCIRPAPAQRVADDSVAPGPNYGLFSGFLSGAPGFVTLQLDGNRMVQNDVFYLWIKRNLKRSVKSKQSTGASIIVVAKPTV